MIHKGTFLMKIKASLKLSAGLSLIVGPIDYVMEKLSIWTIENSDYIGFVFFAIVIDHILGSVVHAFVKRDFTWKKNVIGLVIKLSMVVAMGLLFEGMSHLTREVTWAESYLIMVLRLAVFLYPAGSAAWNCSIITKGKFPPLGFFIKMKQFNKDLDLSTFKTKEKNLEDGQNNN